MKIIKTLPYILIFFLFACKNESRDLAQNIEDQNDTVLRIAPLNIELNKVSEQYKKSKAISIDNFYRKYWPKNDLSGGFLVAKTISSIYCSIFSSI